MSHYAVLPAIVLKQSSEYQTAWWFYYLILFFSLSLYELMDNFSLNFVFQSIFIIKNFFCSLLPSGMKFRCASIECPEVFNGPKPECIYQSQFDRCCGKYECSKLLPPKKKLFYAWNEKPLKTFDCVSTDRDKIVELLQTRCYLENKEYVKGQKMISEVTGCYACICDEHFDNTTIVNNPNCQKVKCNIEIHFADRLMAGCIPIYYGKVNCCPIDWRCRE